MDVEKWIMAVDCESTMCGMKNIEVLATDSWYTFVQWNVKTDQMYNISDLLYLFTCTCSIMCDIWAILTIKIHGCLYLSGISFLVFSVKNIIPLLPFSYLFLVLEFCYKFVAHMNSCLNV